jgi:hypothetical protein
MHPKTGLPGGTSDAELLTFKVLALFETGE